MPMKSVLFSITATKLPSILFGPPTVGDVRACGSEKQNLSGLVLDRLNRNIDNTFTSICDVVRHFCAKDLTGSSSGGGSFNLLDKRWRRRPPRSFPERLADNLVFRKAAAFPGQTIRLDDGSVDIHDSREDRALFKKRSEFRVCGGSLRNECPLAFLDATFGCDITRDLRSTDHSTGFIFNRRNR